LKLGTVFSETARSLAELNAEAEGDACEDPRLTVFTSLEDPVVRLGASNPPDAEPQRGQLDGA
jgi:hypothetical protein